jgi:NTP pyrophosphatase (non-canonical NTP hydrolase)
MPQLQDLINKLTAFRDARDWAQFHDPRNLALALSIEAAELNELFLWKKGEDASTIEISALIIIFSWI